MNLNFPPAAVRNMHTITINRYSIHHLPQKRIYQTLKITQSIPSTKLPHLIPPIILPPQRETQKCHLRSELDLRDGYLPPTRPVTIPLERETPGALSEVYFRRPIIKIYYSRLARNQRYHSIFNSRRR